MAEHLQNVRFAVSDEMLDKLREQREQMGGWYAESGGDTTVCEICEQPLDDTEPWQRGLDGAGAHTECLRPYLESA